MNWKTRLEVNWERLDMKFNRYRMEDVLEYIIDYRGKTPQKSEKGVLTLSAKSVRDGYIDYNQCYCISKEEYARFMVRGFPQIGDVLLTTEAPLGVTARLDRGDVAVAQRLLTLRGKEKVLDTGYLYYYLRSPLGQGKLRERQTGTTVVGIKQAEFRKIEIDLPDIETQRKVTSILSSIDDKIRVNKKINENLEQQAQAYFQNLFIDNANSEWVQGTISDLGTVVGGSTPSKSKLEYYTKDGIAWITPKDLSINKAKFISHGENDITELGLKNSSASVMPEGTVLFSSRAPIGYIAITSGKVTTNQGFKSVVPKPEIGTAFVYYFLKYNLPIIEGMASGSTFKEVSGNTMKNVPAVIPDTKTLGFFRDFCAPIFAQQKILEEQNQSLSALRDSLLPKLMSGEINVSDIWF